MAVLVRVGAAEVMDSTASGPSAVLTANTTSGAAPLSVSLNGTTSKPAPDGSWIAACLLDYGDGSSTTNCWGDHIYTAGTWTARFTVTDNLKRSATATLTVTATGAPPPPPPDGGTSDGGTSDGGTSDGGTPGSTGPSVILTGSPTQGPAPLAVYLDGTKSKPAADGSWIAVCQLDFGDGTITNNCWGSHTYAAGSWTARFTITDSKQRTATATLVINAGGTGGGGTDGGTPTPPPAIVLNGGTPGTSAGWQFFGTAAGGPTRVYGASTDAAGNLWVAGGDQGLYVLTPGSTQYHRFTVADGLTGYDDGTGVHGQPVISVSGGPANTVYVGYQGLTNCEGAFEYYCFKSDGSFQLDTAHQYIWKSGDADRVVLGGAGSTITVNHYDISSPPGAVAAEPQGRERLCTIMRVTYDSVSQSVWFGGNHGIAWGNPDNNGLIEHSHPAINGLKPNSSGGYSYILLTDAYYGLSPLPNGDLWVGGANRSGKFRYSSLSKNFWTADSDIQKNKVDVWPDAVPDEPTPSQRLDDNVSDMAAEPDGSVWIGSIPLGLAHWTPTGTQYYRVTSIDPNSKVTSLERDPLDGSLWIGFMYGGIARLKDGQLTNFGPAVFGSSAYGRAADIQTDRSGATRRILVSFSGDGGSAAGVWIYSGN